MWRDLRSVLRMLITQPLVATVVVGTVALGIGGSVAVFPAPHQYFFPRDFSSNLAYL